MSRAILVGPWSQLHLYDLEAIGLATTMMRLPPQFDSSAIQPPGAECSNVAMQDSCTASIGVDTTDLHESKAPTDSMYEGFSAEQWAQFARRKSRIASSICRANGKLKAETSRKEQPPGASSSNRWADVEDVLDDGKPFDPWLKAQLPGPRIAPGPQADWSRWWPPSYSTAGTRLAPLEAKTVVSSIVNDMQKFEGDDRDKVAKALLVVPIQLSKIQLQDFTPDASAKWGGLVKRYRKHRRGLKVFLEKLTVMNGNVMENLQNMCALYQTMDENLPPTALPEVHFGTTALGMEEFMVSSFQTLQQGCETLQQGQTETVNGLGTLSSQLGNVATRCDDMEKNAKAEKVRLEEAIEDSWQLVNRMKVKTKEKYEKGKTSQRKAPH